MLRSYCILAISLMAVGPSADAQPSPENSKPSRVIMSPIPILVPGILSTASLNQPLLPFSIPQLTRFSSKFHP
jgi:hypothetical protein